MCCQLSVIRLSMAISGELKKAFHTIILGDEYGFCPEPGTKRHSKNGTRVR